MATQKHFNKAFKNGAIAYTKGKTIRDCPHEVPLTADPNDDKYLMSKNWLNGWRFAWFGDKEAGHANETFHPNENEQFKNKKVYS